MITKLAVVALWAEDVITTVHFYRDVLGLSLLPHNHIGWPHFDLGGTYLTILQGHPVAAQQAQPERFPLIALAVDNLAAAVERLHHHGVETPWGIEQGAGSRWVMFHDPAGNLIELVEFSSLPSDF